jgi:hypothetical protein
MATCASRALSHHGRLADEAGRALLDLTAGAVRQSGTYPLVGLLQLTMQRVRQSGQPRVSSEGPQALLLLEAHVPHGLHDAVEWL